MKEILNILDSLDEDYFKLDSHKIEYKINKCKWNRNKILIPTILTSIILIICIAGIVVNSI